MSTKTMEERRRLREAEREARREVRREQNHQIHLRRIAENGLKKLINHAIDNHLDPLQQKNIIQWADREGLNLEYTYEEVKKEREIAALNILKQQEKEDVENTLKQQIEKGNPTSRAELKEYVLNNCSCAHISYDEVEEEYLNSLYTSWLDEFANKSENVTREQIERLAKMIGKNAEKDIITWEHDTKLSRTLLIAKRVIWILAIVAIILLFVFLRFKSIIYDLVTLGVAYYLNEKIGQRLRSLSCRHK